MCHQPLGLPAVACPSHTPDSKPEVSLVRSRSPAPTPHSCRLSCSEEEPLPLCRVTFHQGPCRSMPSLSHPGNAPPRPHPRIFCVVLLAVLLAAGAGVGALPLWFGDLDGETEARRAARRRREFLQSLPHVPREGSGSGFGKRPYGGQQHRARRQAAADAQVVVSALPPVVWARGPLLLSALQ